MLNDSFFVQALGRLPSGNRIKGPLSLRARRIMNWLWEDARIALQLIDEYVDPKKSLLEIGGGIGFVHIWLQRLGLDIISIEPSLAGHPQSFELGQALIERFKLDPARWIQISVKEIGIIQRRFHLIFSYGVLEHVHD